MTNDTEEKVDDVLLQNGCYKFKSVDSNKYIEIPNGSKAPNITMQQRNSHKGEHQEFVIERVDWKTIEYVVKMILE